MRSTHGELNDRADAAEVSRRQRRASIALTDPRWARVALSHLIEPKTASARQLVAAHGPIETLQRYLDGRAGADGSYDSRLAALDVDRAREVLARLHIRVVIPGDSEWPSGVDQLEHPPLCLYVLGGGSLPDHRDAVAIVGARASTAYGNAVAADLAHDLTRRPVTVVSGAAFGIDAAAHRGAIAAGGPTVAVLACGLDRPYPRVHAGLIRHIAETGAVVSELPPGWAPYASRFLARNRIIAAMSVGTVVVEAGLRSGSLSTAREARELHRYVAAVPGPVTSMQSAGCHHLLRTTDAELVVDATEVMDLMGRLSFDAAPVKRAEPTLDGELEPTARQVWSALPVRGPISISRLTELTALPAAMVLGTLGELDLAGLVRREGDAWCKIAQKQRG